MFQSPNWKPKVEGTCQLMCPESETIRRERENLLHPFEAASQKPTRGLLCDAPLSQFNPHLNNVQIADCMATLIQHYEVLCASETESQFQEELESLYFLFHLGSPKALMHLYDLSKNMRKCHKVRVAIDLHRCYWEHNYIRFFRLLKKLSFLELCAVHQHIPFFHRLAIQVMSSAYSSKSLRYPAAHLQKLLCLDDLLQVENLCNCHGISAANEQIQFLKGNWCDNTEKKLLTKYNFLQDVERLEVTTQEQIAKFLMDTKMHADSSPDHLH